MNAKLFAYKERSALRGSSWSYTIVNEKGKIIKEGLKVPLSGMGRGGLIEDILYGNLVIVGIPEGVKKKFNMIYSPNISDKELEELGILR